MGYRIFIRIDGAERRPVLLTAAEQPPQEPGVRWHPVADTNDYHEALWLLDVARASSSEGPSLAAAEPTAAPLPPSPPEPPPRRPPR